MVNPIFSKFKMFRDNIITTTGYYYNIIIKRHMPVVTRGVNTAHNFEDVHVSALNSKIRDKTLN